MPDRMVARISHRWSAAAGGPAASLLSAAAFGDSRAEGIRRTKLPVGKASPEQVRRSVPKEYIVPYRKCLRAGRAAGGGALGPPHCGTRLTGEKAPGAARNYSGQKGQPALVLAGRRVRDVALLLAAALLLPAQNLPEFEKKVTEFTLGNGMHFIVAERHEAPVASFTAFVNVGAVDDPAGESSMAHMFEHMIGKGTRSIGSKNWAEEQKLLERIEELQDRLAQERNRGQHADQTKLKQIEAELQEVSNRANALVEPNAFVRTIEEQGGVGFNAGTAQDFTIYYYSLPSNKVELWFNLQSDWFRRPVLREFYKERDVVREERRMRVESSPQGKLFELLLATSFMAHPYRNLIGWASEIESLRATEAEKFFRKYYVPGNITVAIVGDVNPAEVKRLAEKYYGTIPPGPLPPPVTILEPSQEGEKRAELETQAQPFLMMGYKRPSQTHKDDVVFDVVASILSSGRTGLLYKELVRDKKIAVAASAYASFPSGKYPNLFVLLSVPSPGHTTGESEKAIYGILERLGKEKVDAQTLDRVKTKLRANLIRQLDSNAGLAQQLAFYEVAYSDWRVMFTGLDQIDKVTADDVQRVVREYFKDEKRTVVYTSTPEKPGATPVSEARKEGK